MSDYVVSTYAEALFKLMKNKNIEKITVDELCETGGIGRATYFRNFKSKDEIITKVWGYDSNAVENHVEVYVGFLRKKLRSIGSNVKIEALRRLGYHLEVEEA